MRIFDKDAFYLEINDDVLGSVMYDTIVGVFKKMKFYKGGDFIIPIFATDGLQINAVGEAGVDYRVEFEDAVFEFEEQSSIFLVREMMQSRLAIISVYTDGIFLGSVSVAFVNYILYTYVAVYVFLEFVKSLKESKISRYLVKNEDYPIGFESCFGTLYGLRRISDWSFEVYQDVMTQMVSALKNPITESSLKEMSTSIGFKQFVEDIKRVLEMSGGWNRVNNEKWEVELV